MISTEIYFSIDIEADGPYPGDYSMLSLGAVACLRREGNTLIPLDLDDPSHRFYTELRPHSDNYVESALRICEAGGLNRDHLIVNGQTPESAMVDFENWVEYNAPRDRFKAVMVSYPVWDVQWIYHYVQKYGSKNTFGFSRYVDLKSYYAGKYNVPWYNAIKKNMPKRLKSKRPHTHNALDDAVEQGELFVNVVKDKLLSL